MSKKSIKKKTKEKNSSRHLSELITKKAVFADFVNLRNKKNIANRVLLCLMLVIVSLILFISPFYRGLFFPQELLVANAIIFGLLIVWGLFRTINYDGRLISTPLDICLAVLLIAYLISFFGFAVHKRDALEEVLKIASYIVIYLVVTDICRYWYFSFKKDSTQDEDKESNEIPPGLNIVLHLLFAAATIVTVASLGVAAGHWDFVGAYTSNRIASPMGYANTAAAYLMASYFLTLSLAPLARDKIKLLYLAPAPLMLIAVILTFSRGAWLLLPFLGILMVVISPSGNRVHVFLYLLSTSIPAIPAAFAADSFFRSDSPAWAWLPIIISIIIAMILGRGSEYFISSNRKKRFVISGTIAAFIITGLTLLMLIPLSAPLHLNLDYDESIKEQSYRQLISDVNPQETYLLNMDVNAAKYTLDTGEEPGYVWGVKIIGNNYGRRRVPLFKYEGNATKGWEQFDLNFTTGEETTWFEVILYNEYPGTSFYVRDVVLKGADQEIQLNFALNRVLPERLYNRLVIQDRSVDLRFEFFRDSLKIIKDYPVFGTGGGGWAALYRSYQEIPYASREVHNHYLQVWVESGTIGFIAFTGIWISFTLAFILNLIKTKRTKREWQSWVAVFMPIASLGAHSVIDWNFSMAAVGIFLFVLLGAGKGMDRVKWFGKSEKTLKEPVKKNIIVGSGGIVLGLALSIYSIVLLNGLHATWRSQEYIENNNIKQAISEIEKAIVLDPYRAENYHNYNALIENQAISSQNQAELERLIALSYHAYELEPYNVRYIHRYGDLLFRYVNIREGLSYIDKTIDAHSLSKNTYLNSALARLSLIQYYVGMGALNEAEFYYSELFILEQKMKERYGSDYPLATIIGKAAYLVGDYEKEQEYIDKVGLPGRIF